LLALVVMPTRDLVSQVRETFEAITKGTGLKVSISHSFIHRTDHRYEVLFNEEFDIFYYQRSQRQLDIIPLLKNKPKLLVAAQKTGISVG
jgi:hypothetical protein